MAALLLAEKFNVNHRRSDSLHHVSDEVVLLSRTVGVVLSCNTHTHTQMLDLSLHICECMCDERWIPEMARPVISAASGRSGDVELFYLMVKSSDSSPRSGFPPKLSI